MATKKKAAGTKASGAASKKDKTGGARKRRSARLHRWFAETANEADHSPIIITEGSASIEFTEVRYRHQGNGEHTSTGLFLREVIANRTHPTSPAIAAGDPPGSAMCHSFTGTKQFRIEVVVRLADGDQTFRITGRRSGSFKSPTIKLNLNKFQKDHANFPPKFPQTGGRFVNPGGDIISLKIFSDGTLVHDCPLASTNGIEYTITDPHS